MRMRENIHVKEQMREREREDVKQEKVKEEGGNED